MVSIQRLSRPEKRAVSVFLRVFCGSLRLEDQAFEESEAEE